MINARRKKKRKEVCNVLVQANGNRIERANFVGVKGTKGEVLKEPGIVNRKKSVTKTKTGTINNGFSQEV